jgi:hypothetical protein
MSTTAQEVSLPLEWVEFEETPIIFGNQFLIQHQPDEFVISMGQVTGPPVIGTPEQMHEQMLATSHVPIHTIARVGLTRHRLVELISVLQATLEVHDRVVGG